MERASQEVIAALLKDEAGVRRKPRRRRRTDVSLPVTRDRRRQCQCGHCCRCLENARWERIFAEKFDDPDYYTIRPPRMGSPLSFL